MSNRITAEPRMLPPHLSPVRRKWREGLFTTDEWLRDASRPLNPGEAGGFCVKCAETGFVGYMKPTRVCDNDTPRAANEKIVSDLAYELSLNVPPVLLYRRPAVPIGEEAKCCVSLVMYAQQYEWGMIWNVSGHPEPVQHIIKSSLARYSATFALDLWVGQTDRNNQRNVILGVDNENPSHTEFLFLDHSYTLNHQNRWRDGRWNGMEMVPVPDIFRKSLDKNSVLACAGKICELPKETVNEIVRRIPDDYMSNAQRAVVIEALTNRRKLLEPFLQANL